MPNDINPLTRLRAFTARYPTQKAAAAELRISGAFLSDMLHGYRKIPDAVLARLGLRRAVVRMTEKAS